MRLLYQVNAFDLPGELLLVIAMSRRQIKKDMEISAIINKHDLISRWQFWRKKKKTE